MGRKSLGTLFGRRRQFNIQASLLTLVAIFVSLALWELLSTGQDLHALMDEMGSFRAIRDIAYDVTYDSDGGPNTYRRATAAVFTPYHISPGGGERYLFSIIKSLQDHGHRVDLITPDYNVCKSKEDVLRVAQALRVDLSPANLAYMMVRGHRSTLNKLPWNYKIFFTLGNGKIPDHAGIGEYNVYMCQFPFDLDRPVKRDTEIISTYQAVLLNSAFSLHWYVQYMQPVLRRARASNLPIPSIQVLHPAVDPLVPLTEPVHPPQDRSNIVVLGRIFSGRQSKGHDHAIELLQRLRERLPEKTPNITLMLMGHLQPGHDAYAAHLQEMAKDLPVKFFISASEEEMTEALASARVFWQLTGLEVDEEVDPASIEHFGISTVEVMSSGVIPVGLSRGGSPSIITHGVTGFLAGSPDEFIKYTLQLFSMSDEALLEMQNAARAATERFTFERFSKSFNALCTRGMLSAGFRNLVMQNIRALRKERIILPSASRKVAVIVEPGVKPEFEYVVRNVMTHLGPEWSLVVVNTKANAAFVHHVLKDIVNVRFYGLEFDVSDVSGYNRLLKSVWFWRMLQADKVLVFQSDSIMVGGPKIDEFLSYDYIGAPWHLKNEIWSSPKYGKLIGDGVGNGGFSLRSVQAMIDICETMGPFSPDSENEDIFFVVAMLRKGYNFPSRQIAYSFAQEVPCSDLKEVTPLGLHAKWYYDSLVRRRYFRSDSTLSRIE